MNPNRILVVGTSGSGKTTMARELANWFGLPFSSTDDLYWRPGWVPVSGDEVIEAVLASAEGDRWVVDGNFDDQRARLWPRAELIVWLDLPKRTVLRRVSTRNLAWLITRRTVWGVNRMTPAVALSGIRHAARAHNRKRRSYPHWLAEVGVPAVRLRSTVEVARWLRSLQAVSQTARSKEMG